MVSMSNENDNKTVEDKVTQVQEILKDILEQKPQYGDSNLDISWLRGKQDLAENLLKVLED